MKLINKKNVKCKTPATKIKKSIFEDSQTLIFKEELKTQSDIFLAPVVYKFIEIIYSVQILTHRIWVKNLYLVKPSENN